MLFFVLLLVEKSNYWTEWDHLSTWPWFTLVFWKCRYFCILQFSFSKQNNLMLQLNCQFLLWDSRSASALQVILTQISDFRDLAMFRILHCHTVFTIFVLYSYSTVFMNFTMPRITASHNAVHSICPFPVWRITSDIRQDFECLFFIFDWAGKSLHIFMQNWIKMQD